MFFAGRVGLCLARGVSPSGLTPPKLKPEVLAPAGEWNCARAAVENGADAIFFGVGRFNSRVRAKNFEEADLPELMAYLHGRGVKGYVTFNTLIFPDELAEAARTLRSIVAAGVDAAIVQDPGICRLIRRISPDFPIHASTQMTVTSAAGLDYARDLGASLAVLGREVSIPEMQKLQAEQATKGTPLDLEVFVHGALCVAYSGQCLTSESLGGRSANRGECAQACRLPYELIVDGVLQPLGDKAYLLSPQDLAGIEVVPDLIRAGIRSLKIEGRLKSPEYVAAITKAYRRAVDAAWDAFEWGADADLAAQQVRQEEDYAMQMTFSRGLHTGWLRGIDNQQLVHARFGKKRGAFLGTVIDVAPPGVTLKLEGALKPGDGVVFDQGKPAEREEGGFVHGIEPARGGLTFVRFDRAGAMDWARVLPGAMLWKTKDQDLDKQLHASWDREKANYRRTIDIRVIGRLAQPLRVEFSDTEGHVVTAESSMPCAIAEKRPMDVPSLREQLGRLGDTTFELGALEADLEGALIVPMSELNRLRRDLSDRITALRRQPRRWALLPYEESSTKVVATAAATTNKAPEIVVVIREPEQLEPALAWGARVIYAEFEDPKKFRDAVTRVRAYEQETGKKVEFWVMGPRVHKQGEDRLSEIMLSSQADGYLVRNHDNFRAFAGQRRRGDFSLNVANGLTAEWLMQNYSLEGLTASYDLDANQVAALMQSAPPAWFEVTIHQHMPMFHMEHCVFCAFLSKGKDYRDCGRPCEKHRVKLRDRVGAEHILKADAGCRNTLFNSRAQTGAEYVNQLLALGVRRFRVEFVDEDAVTVTRTLEKYQALLKGELEGTALWNDLKVLNQLGVTRGTMRVRI